MLNFSGRSSDIEIMDDLYCTGPTLERTLIELEIINKWLGGNNITINSIQKLLDHDTREGIVIADLGCGSGEMLRIIDTWAKRKKLKIRLVGIDANPYIISFAKKNLLDCPHIEFQTLNIFSPEFRDQRFDIVIGTLFYHHFSKEQLVQFFDTLKANVTLGIVINDIHRHWLAYHSIKWLTRAFSRSSMVKYDAPLSVLRAFKKKELKEILTLAGIQNFSIQWKWAFRWQVIAKLS